MRICGIVRIGGSMRTGGSTRIWMVAVGLAATGTLCTHIAMAADAFTLVSDDEVAAEQRFESKPHANSPRATERSLGVPQNQMSQPIINVISPDASNAAIASPVRIELQFTTSKDAHVIPDSFKVLYGLLKIDITAKLRPYATVTETGLIADNAALPTGNHRLFLQISDSAGRTATRELKFTVDK